MDESTSNKIVAAILATGKLSTDSSTKSSENYLITYREFLAALDKESAEAANKKEEEDTKRANENAQRWAEATRRAADEI